MKHPHAENMALYAQDAMETDKPWERWQWRRTDTWNQLTAHPTWSTDYEYRRKPRTININGFEVPEPLREAPNGDLDVFLVSLYGGARRWTFTGDSLDKEYLAMGLIHSTKEAAELHAQALISFTKQP